jgi:signal transduction histidine kinase
MAKRIRWVAHCTKSISFRIAAILILFILPLNVISILAARYFVNATEQQSAHNIKNTLDHQLSNLDRQLSQSVIFLSQMFLTDVNFRMVLRQGGDLQYTLSKINLSRSFAESKQFGGGDDMFFFYSPKLDDVLLVRKDIGQIPAMRDKAVREYLHNVAPMLRGNFWHLATLENECFAVRTFQSHNMYFGIFLNLEPFRKETLDMLEYDSAELSIDAEGSGAGTAITQESKGEDSWSGSQRYFLRKVETADFQISIRTDNNDISAGLDFWQNVSRLFPFVYVVLIPVLFVILNGILLRPLKEINAALHRFERGEHEARLADKHEAKELQDIKNSFNEMANNIDKLKIENYEQLLECQKIELQNFQLTIRPHFLQNTFALLYSLTQIGQCKQVGDFIIYLSWYFRSIYQGITHLVDFETELSLIRQYICIMNLQYRERIKFDCEIAENALKVKVPALLIHNFIENAITHGFVMERGLHITLKAHCDGDKAYFAIEDNGVGIGSDVLETINEGRKLMMDDRLHIGLHNSFQRLRLLFPDKGGMRLESAVNRGTVVNVWLPMGNSE